MDRTNSPSLQPSASWRLLVTAALILLSLLASTLLSHGAPILLHRMLAEFPRTVDTWVGGPDQTIDAGTREMLNATDLLLRNYVDSTNRGGVNLFVAFFSSQRKGGTIHSPKNCLPGSGWEPLKSTVIPITVPGSGKTLEVNEYIIQNGLKKQVVLYWYQSQGRIIASEYTAKLCLIWDAIRRNRTDGALVRVISPVIDDENRALETAKSFVQASFLQLTESLPN